MSQSQIDQIEAEMHEWKVSHGYSPPDRTARDYGTTYYGIPAYAWDAIATRAMGM